MRIVEQAFISTERMKIVKTDHHTDTLFQVFVKGRLQGRETYAVEDHTINFGFDVLQPGDSVQIFFLLP